MRPVRVLTALLAAVLTTTLAPATAPPVQAARPDRADGEVLHRVVWDEGRRNGTHLWSAEPDGSDPRPVYEHPTRFLRNVALSRQGSEAAIATIAPGGRRGASLVVVDVLGQAPPTDLLAQHPEVQMVSAVGWAPSGDALAFVGAVRRGPKPFASGLFRIDRDGGGLRRLQPLGPVRHLGELDLGSNLAWTARGVFHLDQQGVLHRFRAGKDRVALRGVTRLAVSGDGAWLFLERRRARRYAMWRMHPDGTGLERLYALNRPGYGYESAPDQGYTYVFQPSYDGSTMLSQLDAVPPATWSTAVTHPATRAPSPADAVLPFDTLGAITWN